MIEVNLDTMIDYSMKNGHLVWNSDYDNKPMRKLRVARELARRLDRDDYMNKIYDLRAEKWGKRSISFDNGKLVVSYENIKSEEEQKIQGREFRRLIRKSDKQKKDEHKQLFELLKKHLNGWWD